MYNLQPTYKQRRPEKPSPASRPSSQPNRRRRMLLYNPILCIHRVLDRQRLCLRCLMAPLQLQPSHPHARLQAPPLRARLLSLLSPAHSHSGLHRKQSVPLFDFFKLKSVQLDFNAVGSIFSICLTIRGAQQQWHTKVARVRYRTSAWSNGHHC